MAADEQLWIKEATSGIFHQEFCGDYWMMA